MFCKHCYADLADAADRRCPKCRRPFDPSNPRTFRATPMPRFWDVVGSFVVTTICAVVLAFAVAFHQAASTSGH